MCLERSLGLLGFALGCAWLGVIVGDSCPGFAQGLPRVCPGFAQGLPRLRERESFGESFKASNKLKLK